MTQRIIFLLALFCITPMYADTDDKIPVVVFNQAITGVGVEHLDKLGGITLGEFYDKSSTNDISYQFDADHDAPLGEIAGTLSSKTKLSRTFANGDKINLVLQSQGHVSAEPRTISQDNQTLSKMLSYDHENLSAEQRQAVRQRLVDDFAIDKSWVDYTTDSDLMQLLHTNVENKLNDDEKKKRSRINRQQIENILIQSYHMDEEEVQSLTWDKLKEVLAEKTSR